MATFSDRTSTFWFLLIYIFFISIYTPTSLSADSMYTICSRTSHCGLNITGISYPFSGISRPDYCGYPGYELSCDDSGSLKMNMTNTVYRITDFNSNTRTLVVARDDYWQTPCPSNFRNSTVDFSLFSYHGALVNLTQFYGCNNGGGPGVLLRDPCSSTTSVLNSSFYYALDPFNNNPSVQAPANCSGYVYITVFGQAPLSLQTSLTRTDLLQTALKYGFGLQWTASDQCNTCSNSGGACGYNRDKGQFTCYCSDGTQQSSQCENSSDQQLITMIKCNLPSDVMTIPGYDKYLTCHDYRIYYHSQKMNVHVPTLAPECSTISIPENDPKGNNTSVRNLGEPFLFLTGRYIRVEVVVVQACQKCYYNGGSCQIRTGSYHCEMKEKNLKYVLVRVMAGTAAGLATFIMTVWLLRGRLSHLFPFFWRKQSQSHQDIEGFLRSHGHLSLRRYRYSDIKKMTNSFQSKLGQGGYGVVYKGKLEDGSVVAVKVLNEKKGNGEEFINEVASISRTSHVNIVTLVGFCFDSSKRALIYEFLSNGSLEKYISQEKALEHDHFHLDCNTMYGIIVGVARGLEYLHIGCNTKIFHFDIKPHNILLDDDFSPKISNFGLAKICPKKESIVSMLGARGTIGYIAPEVFCRNIGPVSNKSDVYSFGMMILEMVGARRKRESRMDDTSEIYFPDWIHDRLESNQELALGNTENEEETEIMRKMVIVSLWCIQTYPTDRPTMGRVLEMLDGNLLALQLPLRSNIAGLGNDHSTGLLILPSSSSTLHTHLSTQS